MTNTQLITFLAAGDFTDEQAFNLLTADIFDSTSPGQLVRSQETISYFECRLRGIFFVLLRPGSDVHVAFIAPGFTDDDAYRELTRDLADCLSPGTIAAQAGTIHYFEMKLREVIFPAIRVAKFGETLRAPNVSQTNAPENVSGAPAPDDRPQVVQNGLDQPSGAKAGE
ncbi:MAG TPA: hypothetical protein VHC90_11470 [Bryobacteraceae bacterium]|nr:hypothetical protein [Bryobacteraceae bacterium]